MNFNYKMEREDLENIISGNYKKINLAYLVVGTIIFLFLTYKVMIMNTWMFIVSLVIYLSILSLVLLLLNKVFTKYMMNYNDKLTNNAYGTYKVTVSSTKIKETINKQDFEMDKKSIKKIKIYKDSIIVFGETKLCFLFYKKLFAKKETFDKLVDYLKDNYLAKKDS